MTPEFETPRWADPGALRHRSYVVSGYMELGS
jgi:hypothetical protein